MSVAQPLPIGFFFVFLETSAIGFAKITCTTIHGSCWLSYGSIDTHRHAM